MLEHQNEHFVRDFLQFWNFVASKLTFSYEFSLEHENLQPQNRCFYLTKCHACHGICTSSPLHAALTLRFAQSKPQDTFKVLRLPHKITMMVSKVLRLPQKMQRIFWKRRKSIAPTTENDFPHTTKHVWISRSATPATRTEATRLLKLPKATPFAKLTIGTATRTVADGCGLLGMHVKRTHPQPTDPQSETWTLATHSGKTHALKLKMTNISSSWALTIHHMMPICWTIQRFGFLYWRWNCLTFTIAQFDWQRANGPCFLHVRVLSQTSASNIG